MEPRVSLPYSQDPTIRPSVQFHCPMQYFTMGCIFHREELLASQPTPKLEDHPLSAVRDCLFNIFAATIHIWRPSSCSSSSSSNGNVSFPDSIIWSEEASFKPNGTFNRHNCVYWSHENPHVTEEQAINLPEISVWCGLSSREMTGPFSFEATITDTSYLKTLQENIMSCISDLFSNDCYFQHDGPPPHY